jgi:DNA ligase-1
MQELFSVFMEQNYEGAMVRNALGTYKNKRSYDLQKVKEFDDAEFQIVDVEEGRGSMKGHAIFVCQAPNGETFNCKMKGDLDNLATIWESKDDYIGNQLTVQYQGLSQYGIPRFPVGVRVREDV